VDQQVNPRTIFIPSLHLRQFVEDAIWNGLADERESGSVVLHFKVSEKKLVCTIEHNGLPSNSPAANYVRKKTNIESGRSLPRNAFPMGSPFIRSQVVVNPAEKNGTRIIITLPVTLH
jgi:LytS/YehU family sensor histidine kinase